MNFIYCSLLLIVTFAAVAEAQRIQKMKFMCDDAINKVSDLGNGAGEQYNRVTKGESKADKVKRIVKEYGEGAKDIIATFRP